jgi:hypothetical protein
MIDRRRRMPPSLIAVCAGLLALAPAAGARIRVDGATAASGRVAAAGYVFAPYLDITQYPTPSLPAIKRASGIRAATVAFVTAQGTTQCVPTWGGYATYPATGSKAFQRTAIAAFRNARGQVAVSFGGEAGAELAATCTTVPALTRAYENVIAAYHPSRIDFDVEGAAVDDPASIARRSQALAAVQKAARAARRSLQISLTLPVLPSGLTADALSVVRSAVRNHVTLHYINLMAMDYGDSAAPDPQGHMAAYAISAARNANRQLHRLYPQLSTNARNRMIGLTPMIGINDVQTETFTLTDAHTLAAYAASSHLGLLSMWQLERDLQCTTPTTSAQIACSSVAQTPYEFSRTLEP